MADQLSSLASIGETGEPSREEQIAIAKALYGTGSRNYLVKAYAEAADDLSEVCSMYAELYGENSDELGMPYMLYAKSLIALAQQGENKVLDLKDEDEEEEDEEEEMPDEAAGIASSNGHGSGPSGSSASEPQAGGSSAAAPVETTTADAAEEAVDEEDENSPTANLQVAWELLELAVQIFTRQGEVGLPNLADVYFELAEISFENSHFDAAVKDYISSMEIRMKLPTDDLRIIAEIQYKIGLSHLMLETYEESVKAFHKACEALDSEIATVKERVPQTEKDHVIVAELEESKAEIMMKVVEVEETLQQSVDVVRQEFEKLANSGKSKADGSGPSSSASASSSTATGAEKPKPMDISHLIKRKKPDTAAETTDMSPAKKPYKEENNRN